MSAHQSATGRLMAGDETAASAVRTSGEAGGGEARHFGERRPRLPGLRGARARPGHGRDTVGVRVVFCGRKGNP
ncbi:hypothetical protein [Streptomyces pseudoechinosporeus]